MSAPHTTTSASTQNGETRHDAALAQVRQSLAGLRYGSVVITVQDGVIVQIDRTEKRRLTRPVSAGGDSCR